MGLIEETVEKQLTRTTVEAEELSAGVLEHFDLAQERFRRARPRIIEMQRRFTILDKGLGLDGKPRTIEGCQTFEEWCIKVLGKPASVVFYLLRGGPKVHEPKAKTDEIHSLNFTSGEKRSLELLFKRYLGDDPSREARKSFLHKTLEVYLSGLLSDEQ